MDSSRTFLLVTPKSSASRTATRVTSPNAFSSYPPPRSSPHYAGPKFRISTNTKSRPSSSPTSLYSLKPSYLMDDMKDLKVSFIITKDPHDHLTKTTTVFMTRREEIGINNSTSVKEEGAKTTPVATKSNLYRNVLNPAIPSPVPYILKPAILSQSPCIINPTSTDPSHPKESAGASHRKNNPLRTKGSDVSAEAKYIDDKGLETMYARLDMPGVSKEGLKVLVDKKGKMLRIEGKEMKKDGDKYSKENEKELRSYSVDIQLDSSKHNLDTVKVEASLKDGVIRILVPTVNIEDMGGFSVVDVEYGDGSSANEDATKKDDAPK